MVRAGGGPASSGSSDDLASAELQLDLTLNLNPCNLRHMKLLITGGAGFVGSNLIRYLLKKYPGYTIINLDRLTYSGNLENLQEVAHLPMYQFIQGDICNEVEVDAIVGQGIDAIIHLASEPHPNPEEVDPSRFIRTDLYGTYVLAEAAVAYNIPRFIHVSTASGYGPGRLDDAQRRPVYEADELKPASPQTASRIGAERLAYSYTTSANLPVTIVRPSSVYGPYQYPSQTMASWITRVIQRQLIDLPASGRVEHDWLHVDDFCTAIDSLLHARDKEVISQVFNIGSGHLRSEIEVVDLLLHFMDRPRELVAISDLASPGEQAVDTTKIERLGWRSQVDFHKGIAEVVRWYEENPQWWEKLKQQYAHLPDQPVLEDGLTLSLSDDYE